MYRSNGNYEAFAKPQRPKEIEKKSAYIIGGVIAGLAAAAFLIRDAQMKGENIHILEELSIPGGSLDGIKEPQGCVIRSGREMENHFECLWDLFRSVPSLEIEDASVLDEFYWLNKKDPNFSNMRATKNNGQDGETYKKNLQAKSKKRRRCDRRDCFCEGFRLAYELDYKPAAAF